MNLTRNLDPKAARLAAVPVFAKADKRSLRSLASFVEEVQTAKGRVLLSEGHRANEIYIIESGTVVVEIDGREIAELGAGEIVGELGYFVGTPATATVKAKDELSLIIIPHNRFDQVLEENPALLRTIASELAERLRAMDERLT